MIGKPLRGVVVCALTSLMLSAASGRSLELFVADAPPVTMIASDKERGIVGDLVVLAIEKAGYAPRIHNLPWMRSQLQVSAGIDQLIIPLSRTPEREEKFTWIAPVMPMERAFFSLDTPVASFQEAKTRYRAIAVGAGTAQLEILKQQGFDDKQIHILKLGDSPVRMLQLGRVDAWFTGVPEGQYAWPNREVRAVAEKLKMSRVLHSVDLYLACSLDCDADVVKRLRSSVQALKQDGTLKKISKSYMKN
ncbi:ABC transporter substrate-binding protein [Rhodoferax sp.]|uniref:substrate-binding periplasmic protein n=1 Tax=Rhodoferax sp. TaxID=50421 RepID=UPI0025D7A3F3|nr:ABC transporter substrate-binding protein [Rhodoferax sp.]